MANNEIVMICDQSGSMHGKEEMTLDGINSIINELKYNEDDKDNEDNKNIKFSLKFFNIEEKLKFKSININHINNCKREDINPSGSTALYDAIGNTINYFIEKKRRNEEAYNTCLVYVITDGLENASKKYDNNKLKQIINIAESNYNITILYLGANQDAILEASKFGVCNDRAMSFNENTRSLPNLYRSISASAKRSLSGAKVNFTEIERIQSQVQ